MQTSRVIPIVGGCDRILASEAGDLEGTGNLFFSLTDSPSPPQVELGPILTGCELLDGCELSPDCQIWKVLWPGNCFISEADWCNIEASEEQNLAPCKTLLQSRPLVNRF